MKKFKTYDEAYKNQYEYPDDQPSGWIQWKGTDVCMDVYCECGAHSHIDAEFIYTITCVSCGRNYFVNGNVELIEIEEKSEYPHVTSID